MKKDKRMELQDHEVFCSKCGGEGVVLPLGEQVASVCPKCHGRRKVDWVSNAMSKAPGTLVSPGVYTQEFDLSTRVLSVPPNDSEVTFYHNGEESIKLTKGGFYVKGKKVAEDKQIYDAFVDFLKQTGTYREETI